MCLHHSETMPPPWSVEKLSSTELVPFAKKAGTAVLEDANWVGGACVGG